MIINGLTFQGLNGTLKLLGNAGKQPRTGGKTQNLDASLASYLLRLSSIYKTEL